MLIDSTQSFLLIVDMQEKLVPALRQSENLVHNIGSLAMAADLLHLPTWATEHCAERIGGTVAQISSHLSPDLILQKTHFCAAKEPEVLMRLSEMGRRQAIICGAEAHVCVLQTALGLLQHGYDVALVADASGTRHVGNYRLAIERLRQAGCQVVSCEMVLFEWLERADQAAFKTLLPIIKSLKTID
ncbi:MAG: isochorismatase family protein [Pseudomonadota bacterium]